MWHLVLFLGHGLITSCTPALRDFRLRTDPYSDPKNWQITLTVTVTSCLASFDYQFCRSRSVRRHQVWLHLAILRLWQGGDTQEVIRKNQLGVFADTFKTQEKTERNMCFCCKFGCFKPQILSDKVTCTGTSNVQAATAWETYAFNSNVLSNSVFVGLGVWAFCHWKRWEMSHDQNWSWLKDAKKQDEAHEPECWHVYYSQVLKSLRFCINDYKCLIYNGKCQ